MSFLDNPGRPGAFGAILDEYSRAAEDLCQTVEALSVAEWIEQRPSKDPDCVSLQAIGAHCVNAAYGYSNSIRRAREQEPDTSGRVKIDDLPTPKQLRPHLEKALRHSEATLEGLFDADEKTILALSFQVSWGPSYDPESILEHGIVHLLRHRRQIERWNR